MISDDDTKVTPSSGNIWKDLEREDAEEMLTKSREEGDVLLAINLLKRQGIIPYDFDYKTHYLIAIYEE